MSPGEIDDAARSLRWKDDERGSANLLASKEEDIRALLFDQCAARRRGV